MRSVTSYEGGVPTWERKVTANDSDKTLTVPAGYKWIPYCIWIDFTATATVGARSIYCRITDGTNVIWQGSQRLMSVSASQTGGSHIVFGPLGEYFSSSFPDRDGAGSAYDVKSTQEYPAMELLAGYEIHIWDSAAVDAAADDMNITIFYKEVNV